VLHPFQSNALQRDPRWQSVEFNDVANAFFEACARDLEREFRSSVAGGSLRAFVRRYLEVAETMLPRTSESSVLLRLLPDALRRLICYFDYLRLRTRDCLDAQASVLCWDLGEDLVRRAQQAAAEQERDGTARRDYDLRADPELRAWLMSEVRPVVEDYVGIRVGLPQANIRYANSTREGEPWPSYDAVHPYEEFHFDEPCYTQRMILYLNDVDAGCGPFTYVDGSDRMEQSLVVRAFHQAVDHCQLDFYDEADRRRIGRLPASFRGGDMVGRFAGPEPFDSHSLLQVTGPAGRLLLYDGFELIHAGGFPEVGMRKAMFIAFRFPRKKLGELAASAVARFAARRLR